MSEPKGIEWMDPRKLRTGEPFNDLFEIKPDDRAKIERSIEGRGYDASRAIDVWREADLVIDGHTRLSCALTLGVREVPVCFHHFETEEAALAFAFSCQEDRRKTSDAELLRYIRVVDQRRKRGGDRGNQHTGGKASLDALPKSAEHTAAIVGISTSKVERARAIIDHAQINPEPLREVAEGRMNINTAVKVVRAERKALAAKKPKEEKPNAKKAKKAKKHFPDPVVPAAQKPGPHVTETPSARLVLMPEEEKWLASFPIRNKVVKHRFDDDALIWRFAQEHAEALKRKIAERIGMRSHLGMGIYYRVLSRFLKSDAPGDWEVCEQCNGAGTKNGPCKPCRGGGYIILSLRRDTV